MEPDDRILVGVINRKRDLKAVLDEHWYRIPQEQQPNGIHTEYVAFYCSKAILAGKEGGIYYYARWAGTELARRRDLIPSQPNHKRADKVYYRLALSDIQEKHPPILNPENRVIAFIYTTWDRFVQAREIKDLYSDADYFVDRIYHALRNRNMPVTRTWEAEGSTLAFAPSMSILCENGPLDISAKQGQGVFYMDMSQGEDSALQAIIEEIKRRGGPATINIPPEGL